MSGTRPYPPDWLDNDAAAYMLSMAPSTFRDFVARGILPEGIKIGGKRLWSRTSINDALEKLANPALISPIDKAIGELIDGEKAKGRRHAA
jgi:predicted DNA-binding transcriptional regulator AlpA